MEGGDVDEPVAAPDKRFLIGVVGLIRSEPRPADDVAGVVDCAREASGAAERAEVREAVALAQEGVLRGGPDIGKPDDVAMVVDGVGDAVELARQEAESGHAAALPEEGLGASLVVHRPADHLAAVVDGEGSAGVAAQGPEVDDLEFAAAAGRIGRRGQRNGGGILGLHEGADRGKGRGGRHVHAIGEQGRFEEQARGFPGRQRAEIGGRESGQAGVVQHDLNQRHISDV